MIFSIEIDIFKYFIAELQFYNQPFFMKKVILHLNITPADRSNKCLAKFYGIFSNDSKSIWSLKLFKMKQNEPTFQMKSQWLDRYRCRLENVRVFIGIEGQLCERKLEKQFLSCE